MTWRVAEKPVDPVVLRRFGHDHDKPCRRPEILTCARWECQVKDSCQHPVRPFRGLRKTEETGDA